MQERIVYTTRVEIESYRKRFEEVAAKEDEDAAFSTLLLARERCMRELVLKQALQGQGLAIVEGMATSERIRNRPSIIYDSGDRRFGRSLRVLFVIDDEDPELDGLGQSIHEALDVIMPERVARFNVLPDAERQDVMAAWKNTGQITPRGFTSDLMYAGGHRLRFSGPHALLSYRPWQQ